MSWWGWVLGYVVVAAGVSVELAARTAYEVPDRKVDVGVVVMMSLVWPATLLASAWVFGFEWRREALARRDAPAVPPPPPLSRSEEWD